jgi:hypothetical protein
MIFSGLADGIGGAVGHGLGKGFGRNAIDFEPTTRPKSSGNEVSSPRDRLNNLDELTGDTRPRSRGQELRERLANGSDSSTLRRRLEARTQNRLANLDKFTGGNGSRLRGDTIRRMVPGRRPTLTDRLNAVRDEAHIAKIYTALAANTEYGPSVISGAKKHGLPRVIFDEELKPGQWGGYNKSNNTIHLNPVYRTLPPEVGAATLAHELVHRQARWVTNSIHQEIVAHTIEALVWNDLKTSGLTNIRPGYTAIQIRAIATHNKVLNLVNKSIDFGNSYPLVKYLKNVEAYQWLPKYGQDLTDFPPSYLEFEYYRKLQKEIQEKGL